MYWAAKNSKGKQYKKEIREVIVRDPQSIWDISLFFLIMDYNVLTKTCYKVQISSKIINLDDYLSL